MSNPARTLFVFYFLGFHFSVFNFTISDLSVSPLSFDLRQSASTAPPALAFKPSTSYKAASSGPASAFSLQQFNHITAVQNFRFVPPSTVFTICCCSTVPSLLLLLLLWFGFFLLLPTVSEVWVFDLGFFFFCCFAAHCLWVMDIYKFGFLFFWFVCFFWGYCSWFFTGFSSQLTFPIG